MKKSFEDLLVWKKSCQLSVNVYNALKDCKDYGFKNQCSGLLSQFHRILLKEKKEIPLRTLSVF